MLNEKDRTQKFIYLTLANAVLSLHEYTELYWTLVYKILTTKNYIKNNRQTLVNIPMYYIIF